MNFKIPHQTSKSDARKKVEQALRDAKPHLAGHATIDTEEWDGDILHFGATLQGKRVTGTLEVTDTDLVIHAQLPLMWRLFEGRIEAMIGEYVRRMQ